MINLIPPEGQRVIKKEYIFRVCGTLAFLFGSVFLVLTVALIPTYILIGTQMNAFSLEIQKQSEQASTINKLDEEIKFANAVFDRVKNATGTSPASDVIHEIQKIAGEEIEFKSITVNEPNAKGVITTQAQGVAPTREILAKFRTDLIATDLFDTAEIPIANLVPESELPFTITMTLVLKK